MTEQEILAQLTRWQEAMIECDGAMSNLSLIVGNNPEAPMPSAVYGLMGAYTEAIAEAIDWDTEVLSDWWLNHRFGERPLRIGFHGEELRSIDSVEALAAFIAEDQRSAA